jgi:AraC-like DNA-binding protein
MKCLGEGSWAEDFTRSRRCRQQFLYIQAAGHYMAAPEYAVLGRSGLHSCLILYTLGGRGVVEYRGKKAELTEGSIALIDCDLAHSYYCRPSGGWDFYWLHFSGNCIDGYIDGITENWGAAAAAQEKPAMEKLMKLARSQEPAAELECSTLLIDLCSRLLLRLMRENTRPGADMSPVIQAAVTYMEENCTRDVTLNELCAAMNISKYYFSHCFRRQTGSSPHEYLIGIRITRAKSLLRSTGYTVAEIAELTGFGDSSYFVRCFRAREGVTPLRYRNYFFRIDEG